ncbi:hypothetical protein PR048_028035 [Dryococelus australis]|uniref:Uncharacterized protein n=1 Tax=Dryococelus australis TaxID=614101 RepID=A0ABQ9GI50_9NEOP|nr:hypothetical protein PR048_028035 [Dryococelus australis]
MSFSGRRLARREQRGERSDQREEDLRLRSSEHGFRAPEGIDRRQLLLEGNPVVTQARNPLNAREARCADVKFRKVKNTKYAVRGFDSPPGLLFMWGHQRDPGSIPGRITPNFRIRESCWTMPFVSGFSRESPVSPAPSFRRCSIPTSVTLIGSQDLDFKSRPNLFTLLFFEVERMYVITEFRTACMRIFWEFLRRVLHCCMAIAFPSPHLHSPHLIGVFSQVLLPPLAQSVGVPSVWVREVLGSNPRWARFPAGFSHVGIVPGGFSRDLTFPPPLHSGAAPHSPHFIISSQYLNFKSRPNLFIHFVCVPYTNFYWAHGGQCVRITHKQVGAEKSYKGLLLDCLFHREQAMPVFLNLVLCVGKRACACVIENGNSLLRILALSHSSTRWPRRLLLWFSLSVRGVSPVRGLSRFLAPCMRHGPSTLLKVSTGLATTQECSGETGWSLGPPRRITGVGVDSRWKSKTLYILPHPSGRQSLMEAVWPSVRERSAVWTTTGRRRVRCSWRQWTRGCETDE